VIIIKLVKQDILSFIFYTTFVDLVILFLLPKIYYNISSYFVIIWPIVFTIANLSIFFVVKENE
jgi:hypothetical protein